MSQTSGRKAAFKVRVLTFNTTCPVFGSSNRQERLEDLARQCSEFDVIGLQEVHTLNAIYSNIPMPGGTNNKEMLKRLLMIEGFKHFAMSPNSHIGQCSGLMICSKFPFDVSTEGNPSVMFIPFRSWVNGDFMTSRGALVCRVKVHPSLPALTVVNAQFQTGGLAPKAVVLDTRLAQIEQVREFFKETNTTNFVWLGDMMACAREEGKQWSKMKAKMCPKFTKCRDVFLEDCALDTDWALNPDCEGLRPYTSPLDNGSRQFVLLFSPEMSGPRWEFVTGTSSLFCPKALKNDYGYYSGKRGEISTHAKGTISDHFGIYATFTYKQHY